MIPKAVIYCRCSTEEESQRDALVKQVAEAKECVHKKGWLLVDSYVESRSGTSTRGRAEYNRLYEDLLRYKFDIIVIKSQDRLMRNTKDWYLFVDRLTTTQKRLYMYMEQKFYSTDDALITGIKAILAEDYSRELSKKMNHAHHNRQKNNGAVILTSNTYGYKKLPDKSVAIIEEEAEVKRRMYQLCAAGYGSPTIASILKKDGIVNHKGNPFSDADIRRMIRNPLNKGTVVMNKIHYDFDSKRTMKVPCEEQFVYENKVPAIVSPELWERANQEMDRRVRPQPKKDRYVRGKNPGRFPLSGKIFCGLCGEPYYRTVRRRYSDGKKLYEWKCRRYLENGRSASPNTRPALHKGKMEQVKGCDNIHLKEDIFYEFLNHGFESSYPGDKSIIVRKMIELLEIALKEKDNQPEIEKKQKKLEEIRRQMNLLVDKLLNGTLADKIYQTKQKELEDQLQKIQETIEKLEKGCARKDAVKVRIARIEKYLREGNGIQKAAAAEMLDEAERIVVYPRHMEIYFGASKLWGIEDIQRTCEALPDRMRIDYGNAFHYLEKKREDRELIVTMLKENPQITARQIAEQQNISLSGVNYKIKVLKKEGRIRFCGAGGKGKWEVFEE